MLRWEVLWGMHELCGANRQQRDECRAATRNIATHNIATHDIIAYNGHDAIAMAHTTLQK